MTTDEKVKLAEEIAGRLVGIVPSEWGKWAAYAARHGVEKGLRFARTMMSSPSLRPGQRRSYQTIFEVLSRFEESLRGLPSSEVAEILGYVRQSLIARRAASVQ